MSELCRSISVKLAQSQRLGALLLSSFQVRVSGIIKCFHLVLSVIVTTSERCQTE
jgi:hypothetical protein